MFSYEFTVDKELRINYWDKRLEEIMGRSGATVLGVPYFQIQPRIINGNADAVEQVLRDGKSAQLRDYQVPCLCGVSKADICINPLTDQNSVVTGARITIEMLPECFLANMLNESRALINIGKASACLAHGVRSPLNAIKGAVTYLQGRYNADPVFVEFTKIIEDEISRLDKFVTRFLSNSMSEPEIADVELNELLDKVVTLLNIHANTVNITLVRCSGDIPTVRTDYFQIEHAMLNIINNAIESMDKGGNVFVKTFVAANGDKKHVTVEVSDSGHGFEGSNLAHTLKDESTKKGRGFGLFITHEIIKNLGGFLEISSEKMLGTTVRIKIPIDQLQG
jgi:two-component system, NtrC family, nitrogen regulation sensor histidine kinase GlnL